jgi:glyoxylase-like metal-dependent hydrolase (beta-lactamase superfamily II)
MSRPTEELAPKLWRVPVPISALAGAEHLGFTNCYLIGGTQRWLLVDTGMATDDAFAAFEHGLVAAGLRWRDIDLVAITHHHPDHYGASAPIRERTGAAVLMHRRDIDVVFDGIWGGSTFSGMIANHGGPTIDLPQAALVQIPGFRPTAPDALLADDEHIDLGARVVRAVHTPGHTPGHLCFDVLHEDLILTGDHILPRITPHVGYYPGSDDPLGEYLDSLKKIGEGSYQRALPAHGEPFLDVSGRIARIVRHHERRLIACVEALGTQAPTGWDIVGSVFGDVADGFHRFAALFEGLAHLVLAESRGMVERITDGDVIRWRRT